MSNAFERNEERMSVLPKPVKSADAIPAPCSVAPFYPDILLRNDGFNADAAYTLDSFYAHLANILGNMVRMETAGAVLQVHEDDQGQKSIDVLFLYDARRQLTTSFSIKPEDEISFKKTPGGRPSILHEQPELWNHEGELSSGTKVTFTPVYDIPLNYTADAKNSEGADKRSLDAPAMVVAYGKTGVIDYAYTHFMNPPKPKATNPLQNEEIGDALMLLMTEVTRKIAVAAGASEDKS